MKTSESALKKIKEFEGCRLKAYKPVAAEKYWTIGVGHYGSDVTEGMTITENQAMDLLRKDIAKFESHVTATGLTLTQNQFDALVSFTYNCGPGNLAKLIRGRDYQQIADAMLFYTRGADKKVLKGLVRRREWERNLFLSGGTPVNVNPYARPYGLVKPGMRGEPVQWVQWELNQQGFSLKVDGIYGPKTEDAVRTFQSRSHLACDAIVGPRTIAALID